MVPVPRNKVIQGGPDPSKWNPAQQACEPLAPWQSTKDRDPRPEAGMPEPVWREHMHSLGKFSGAVRCLCRDFRAIEVAEIEAPVTVVRFDQAPCPQTKVATSVCVDP